MRIYENISEIYDLGWGEFAEQYLSFINRLLDKYRIRQARILDVACGTGILAIALAKQGHSVCGIDISPEMIAVARTKASGITGLSFSVQDMSNFKVHGVFDLITCTYDAINYLIDPNDVTAMFGHVARSLRKSGLFVFDSNTTQHYISLGKGSYRQEIGGKSFSQMWRYNSASKIATIQFKFSDGDVEVHRQRPYKLSELIPIMSASGFRVIKALSSFDNSPYNDKSMRLICVAQLVDLGRFEPLT